MFKGFQFTLPEYTVVTPQTGESYSLRSLTVAEVNKLKTSLVTPTKAHTLINNILWESIQTKPNDIKTIDQFKHNITTIDRESLLYGLYVSTFGSEREFTTTCGHCEAENRLKVDLGNMFTMNAFPGSETMKSSYKAAKALDDADTDPEVEAAISMDEYRNQVTGDIPDGMPPELAIQEGLIEPEKAKSKSKKSKKKAEAKVGILGMVEKVTLPVSGVIAHIRQPTLYDEENIMGRLGYLSKKQSDLINDTLIISKFEQYSESDKSTPSLVVEDREDILWGFQSLPERDRKKIFEVYNEKFGQYGMSLSSHYACSECGEDNELGVSITMQFFRMVRQS